MNIIFLCLPAILASPVTVEGYGNFDNVSYVRNYDGDTITVNIDGVHDIIGKEIPIRVKGVDTPEISGECPEEIAAAEYARDFVKVKIENAAVIDLKNIDRDKYFRILADVEFDGVNLATILLNEGLGIPYDGGTKINWCEHLND